ncbi:MAG: MMPL family transporter [Deltaproteobacteria bacterium]|jgi:predicted RND superfamily exporter protein|nr:MMPL family transporter [Deltaproteobacteria bacterium]
MFDSTSINSKFRSLTAAVLKRRLVFVILALVLTSGLAAGLPRLEVDTSQESWLLAGDKELLAKERFEAIFGKDDFCGVLVRSDNITSPESLALIREMGRELMAEVPYASEVVSITDFEFTRGVEGGVEIVNLVPDDLSELSAADFEGGLREQILTKPMFRNTIISLDGTEAWVVLRLKPTSAEQVGGSAHADYLIGEKVLEITRADKYAPLRPKAAGLAVIEVEKRLYFGQLTGKLIMMSILIIALAVALLTRNYWAVFFPFLVTVMALLSVFGLEGHLRMKFDPVTVFLPIFLALAMSTCYAVHLLNFFNNALAAGRSRLDSALHAAEMTGWPLLSSALTTMGGMISFMIVPVRPLRFVGLTAALLVGFIFVFVYVLLPIFLSVGGRTAPRKSGAAKSSPGLADRFLDMLGRRVLNRPGLVLGVFFVSFVVLMTGLRGFEVSFDIRRSYGTKVRYIQDMFTVGLSQVGSLYSYGMAVELPSPDMAKDPEVLRNLKTLEEEIKARRLTKRVTSVVAILEDLNQVVNDGNGEFYKLPETREEVAQLLLLYENAGGTEPERWVDYDYQRLRLLVEVDDYSSAEVYQDLVEARRRAAELFPGSEVILTGALSQFTVMMEYVTWGQIKTFFLALAMITLVMVLTFRSLKIALMALVPNAVPVLAISGLMGWMRVPLDVMTVTIVPMLLGLAVDDTIHFIVHSGREFQKTGSYARAVFLTEKNVGKAIILTSVILILAFSPYLASEMLVFVNMGILIGLGVFFALLADLLVTPVMIKLTACFGPERTTAMGAGESPFDADVVTASINNDKLPG